MSDEEIEFWKQYGCVKTGAVAKLIDGRWAYGDMHRFGETFVFRICEVSGYGEKSRWDFYHYKINNWKVWFDEWSNTSTMIITSDQIDDLGYDGVHVHT